MTNFSGSWGESGSEGGRWSESVGGGWSGGGSEGGGGGGGGGWSGSGSAGGSWSGGGSAGGSYDWSSKASSEQLVGDEVREWVDNAFSVVIFTFSSLGTITNAINIRVFVHQGVLSDSNTIGLFSLAISDCACCLFHVFTALCPILRYAASSKLFFNCVAFTTLTNIIPHAIMSRITLCITVYISIERSLCVLLPFKVRTFFRPSVTSVYIIFVYATVACTHIPFYLNAKLVWVFMYHLNTTVAMLTQAPEAELIISGMNLTYNTILSAVAILLTFGATWLMIYKLRQSRKWRKSVSGVAQSAVKTSDPEMSKPSPEDAREKKELEVMKTVTMVTGLFCVCAFMNQIPGMVNRVVDGFSPEGTNSNLFFLSYSYRAIFALINSAFNFFFYIRISSRYKAAFDNVFRKSGNGKSKQRN